MKKHRRFLIAMLTVVLFVSLFSVHAFAIDEADYVTESEGSLFATPTIEIYNLERLTAEMFGDVQIQSSDYLHSLDDSADFVYVEFVGGGYAIYLKSTMELMEYSAHGNVGFDNSTARKYYGGPGSYFKKDGMNFVDVDSGQVFTITDSLAKEYSQSVREALTNNTDDIETKVEFDYNTVGEIQITETFGEQDEDISTMGAPNIGDPSLITGLPISDGTYIPNYKYFLLNPTHGNNTSLSCGAIAVQLLLGYHNYFSDRRIIENRYLNGDYGATRNDNPNYCDDPMLMTSQTLGTRGSAEDGSDDPNSYFSKVLSVVPLNAYDTQVKSGIQSLLNENGISYTVNLIKDSSTSAVNPNGIVSEINSGHPTIVLMQTSLGGADHYVVAYGYHNYKYPGSSTEYLGFVVHNGYGLDTVDLWINSSWCVSYITLEINHTHRYYKYSNLANSNRTEFRCWDCDHRTDAAIDMEPNTKYSECVVDIPTGEYRECFLTFDTAGNRLVQTFGGKDAIIYLYDSEYNLLDYDDDDGFYNNSMINYNFAANTVYYLRVRFYHSTVSGEVKIGVTPSYNAYTSSGDILNENTYAGVTYYVSTQLNGTKVLAFTPTDSGTFTIETKKYGSSYVDTYLYVVDTAGVARCLYNDDSGGNSQASITTDLVGGRTYFIVVSTFNITTTGQFYLDISRQ